MMFGHCEGINLLTSRSNPNSSAMAFSLDDSSSTSTQPLWPWLVANAWMYLIKLISTCPFTKKCLVHILSIPLTNNAHSFWLINKSSVRYLCALMCYIIHTFSTLLIMSTLSLKQYQYPFLDTQGPNNSCTSSSWKSLLHLKLFGEGPLLQTL